jgi:hypothetical protein
MLRLRWRWRMCLHSVPPELSALLPVSARPGSVVQLCSDEDALGEQVLGAVACL